MLLVDGLGSERAARFDCLKLHLFGKVVILVNFSTKLEERNKWKVFTFISISVVNQ